MTVGLLVRGLPEAVESLQQFGGRLVNQQLRRSVRKALMPAQKATREGIKPKSKRRKGVRKMSSMAESVTGSLRRSIGMADRWYPRRGTAMAITGPRMDTDRTVELPGEKVHRMEKWAASLVGPRFVAYKARQTARFDAGLIKKLWLPSGYVKRLPNGMYAVRRNPFNYAHLVELGHKGPAPAPAYPFRAPAFGRTAITVQTLLVQEIRARATQAANASKAKGTP